MLPEKWPTDTLQPATVSAVKELVATTGSYRKAAKRLGVSHAAVWNIAHERGRDVSRATENKVRTALGLPPIRRRTWTRWADAPVSVLAQAIVHREEI